MSLLRLKGHLALWTLVLAASLGGLTLPADADWIASGHFYYRDREQDLSGFTGTAVDRPARLVDVEIVDAVAGTVLAVGATNQLGAFSIPVTDAQTRDVRARFLSRSDYTSGLYLEVQNNQTAHVVYAVTSSVVVGHAPNANVDFGDLTALPLAGGEAFNCYDVALNSNDHLAALFGSWPLTACVIFWQNGGSDGTYFRGFDNTIHLTGDEGYDDTVIAHEHGHFVSKNYSKDNNPGGQHFLGDNNQDIRLSWSEGYATYWGSSVRRELGVSSPTSVYYIDTTGLPGAGNLDFSYELETPSVTALGAASEVSVQALLWDVTDDASTGDDSPGLDDDPLVAATDADVWEVTRNYFPEPAVTNVSLEDFWDGWFRPGFSHGFAAEMLAIFSSLRVEYFEDSFENDDGIGVGGPITKNGAPQAHTFYPSGDADFAWFPASVGQAFILETTDLLSDGNTVLTVLDTLGAQLLPPNDNRSGGDESSRILFTAPYTGRFFVRVHHAVDNGVYGSYNLRVLQGMPSAVTFANVSGPSGTAMSGNSRGTAWSDFDGDGDLDLYCTNIGSANQLFRNQGNGTFVNDAALRGVALNTQSEGACFGDYDNDGDADLYVTSVLADDMLYQNQLVESGTPSFLNVTAASGITDVASGRTACWIDANRDGHLDLFVANIEDGSSRFWRNEGDGTFEDASATVGLDISGAITACFADADQDGDADVFVGVNGGPSRLLRNDGGAFVDVTSTAGTVGGNATFAAHWGDYDGNGFYDLTIADSNGPDFLYRNMGGLVFDDVSVEANAASPLTGVGSIFVDHDLDADLDIYTVNFNGPAQLYDNINGTSFSVTGAAASSAQSRSVSQADYDEDGDADFYIATQTTNILLRNDVSGRPWLQVRTIGQSSNRDGFGARILAVAGGRRQWREMTSGQGFGSQNAPRAHFGFGAGVALIDTVMVDWPSGKRSILAGIPVDTVLVVNEAGAIGVADGPGLLASLRLAAPFPNPSARVAALQFEAPAHLVGQPLRVEILDVAGRRLATLLEGPAARGPQRLTWDLHDGAGRRVAPGIYFASVRCGPEAASQKLVVLQP